MPHLQPVSPASTAADASQPPQPHVPDGRISTGSRIMVPSRMDLERWGLPPLLNPSRILKPTLCLALEDAQFG